MKNKAQASLEFVTTYSWAIALVLIMIGALMYFGVFDTEVFLKPYCEVSKELVCEDYAIFQDHVDLELHNNFEKAVSIRNFTIYTGINDNPQKCDTGGVVIPVGQSVGINCSWGSNVLPSGEKERVGLEIEYSRDQGTNTYTVRGSLLAQALEP